MNSIKTVNYYCGKKIHLIFLSIWSIVSFAQNIVPNPGFENYHYPPKRDGNFSALKNWKSASGVDAVDYKYGTPDFFHKDGSGRAKIPDTQMGVILPFEGKGVAGILTYNGEVENFREYIYTELISSLTPKEEYIISFSVSNGFLKQYGRLSSNGLGLLFSRAPPKQTQNEVISAEPQIMISELICTDSWKTFTFTFIADDAYKYITIGNFLVDDDIRIASCFSNVVNNFAYYLFDEIKITPKRPVPSINAIDDQRTTKSKAVAIPILDNDNYPKDEIVRICHLTYPTHGIIVQNNEQIIYTPSKGFEGKDRFTYTICLDNGTKSIATVFIDVLPQDLPPPPIKEPEIVDIPPNLEPLAKDDYYVVNDFFYYYHLPTIK